MNVISDSRLANTGFYSRVPIAAAFLCMVLSLFSCESTKFNREYELTDDVNWESLVELAGKDIDDAENSLQNAGFEFNNISFSYVRYTRSSESSEYQHNDDIFLRMDDKGIVVDVDWVHITVGDGDNRLGKDYVEKNLLGKISTVFPDIKENGVWEGGGMYDGADYYAEGFEESVKVAQEIVDKAYNNFSICSIAIYGKSQGNTVNMEWEMQADGGEVHEYVGITYSIGE